MLKIWLADPQDIIFHGLTHMLRDDSSFQITSRVKDRSELFSLLDAETPDILIIDDTGIRDFTVEDCRYLLEQHPRLKIFFLTDQYDRVKSMEMIKSGAHAYLTKNCSRMEILYALQMVRDDQKFFCNKVLDVLTNPKKEDYDQEEHLPGFSDRELQVMELIAQDLSTPEIADKLALSPHTIHAHRKKILRKLKVNSPVGMIRRALLLGILHLRDGKLALRRQYKAKGK